MSECHGFEETASFRHIPRHLELCGSSRCLGMAAYCALPRTLLKARIPGNAPKMAAAVRGPQQLIGEHVATHFRSSLDLSNTALPSLDEALRESAQSPFADFQATRLVQTAEIAVGGHRGMGMNRKSAETSYITGAYRENTVKSFCEAAACGASFVEFDVQVTKDGVPVLWHDDFAVVRDSSGGHTKRMINEIGLEQFQGLTSQQLVRECQGMAEPLDWKCDVEHKLPTLDEVFRGVPESVGFDIEIKMTTPASERRTPPEEVDRVVSAVLREVREWEATSYRRVVFSTFDPDVALELKCRQSSIPVLFLSDGMMHYADHRRCGLATAVAVAFRYGLDGVVLEVAELADTPGLVSKARQLGLHVLTYGVQNNDPARVRQQEGWGVQAAIVDNVKRVVQGLALCKDVKKAEEAVC